MIKIGIFIVITICLAWWSRASLRSPKSHGFTRFFAWECILALFLMNIRVWFSNPLSAHQIIAWILLTLCIIPVVCGVHMLRKKGKPGQERADAELAAFEKTTALVTTGIYKYIRHPLYCSLLLLTYGVFFKNPSIPGLCLASAASVLLFFTARADEKECISYFGPEYQDYMKKTKMFIPSLF